MIPVSCVFEYLIHGKTFSAEVKASIAVVLLGVGIVTVTDLDVNFAGLVTAVLAVFATSLQQIVRFRAVLPTLTDPLFRFRFLRPSKSTVLTGPLFRFRSQ